MPTKQYALEVGGPKRVKVSYGMFWKNFLVEVDGREVGRIEGGLKALRVGSTFALANGSELKVRVATGLVAAVELFIDGKPVPGSAAVPLPKWSYFFIGGCAVIPIVAAGGAIPAAIGVSGALGCAALARDESKSVAVRLTLCTAITVVAWIAFAALILAMAAVKTR
ncbi:MAG TPA: hypothetical protein VNN72_16305 [Polyangiaceae bacterium]|nr:hypothetical protein [Polyangiaceae bacterium]